jgi:methylase of polypeptide subunit release factors
MMLERAWQWLLRASAVEQRFPPPRIVDAVQARAVHEALKSLLDRNEDRFRSLFLKAQPLKPDDTERPWMEALAAAGYVQPGAGGAFRPCVRVFFLDGLLIATDLLAHQDEDQVFSLMLEQVFLVRSMDVRKGEHVLELCLGSGVNAIAASHCGAARVVGVDINPRALAFAAANAAVNLSRERGEAPVEMLQGNLFDPLSPDDRFDLVLVNPPFEPVPPDTEYFLHSHGGEDGLDVVRIILPQVQKWLHPGGRFEMYTGALGDDHTERASDLAVAAFPGFCVEVRLVDRFPLEEVFDRYVDRPGHAGWRRRLTDQGLTYVWGVHVRAHQNAAPGLVFVDSAAEISGCDTLVTRWTQQ